jgi:hypothetical protein
MDFFKIFSFSNPLWWITMISLALFIIFIKLFEAKLIGKAGEKYVRKELKLLDDNYKVLNDIMIETKNGTCQIDHLVISKYGIFVIETKQYNGYITGSKYDKKWVRHLKNKKKVLYTNPIKQNYGHVISICELLNIEESKVFNIVCIPSRARLKINDDGETTRINNIIEKIISYNDVIIENEEELYNIIVNSNITDKKRRKEHNKNLHNKYKNSNDNICPKCGNELVLKNGKYGPFYGCSNYPNCKYTKKLLHK